MRNQQADDFRLRYEIKFRLDGDAKGAFAADEELVQADGRLLDEDVEVITAHAPDDAREAADDFGLGVGDDLPHLVVKVAEEGALVLALPIVGGEWAEIVADCRR